MPKALKYLLLVCALLSLSAEGFAQISETLAARQATCYTDVIKNDITTKFSCMVGAHADEYADNLEEQYGSILSFLMICFICYTIIKILMGTEEDYAKKFLGMSFRIAITYVVVTSTVNLPRLLYESLLNVLNEQVDKSTGNESSQSITSIVHVLSSLMTDSTASMRGVQRLDASECAKLFSNTQLATINAEQNNKRLFYRLQGDPASETGVIPSIGAMRCVTPIHLTAALSLSRVEFFKKMEELHGSKVFSPPDEPSWYQGSSEYRDGRIAPRKSTNALNFSDIRGCPACMNLADAQKISASLQIPEGNPMFNVEIRGSLDEFVKRVPTTSEVNNAVVNYHKDLMNMLARMPTLLKINQGFGEVFNSLGNKDVPAASAMRTLGLWEITTKVLDIASGFYGIWQFLVSLSDEIGSEIGAIESIVVYIAILVLIIACFYAFLAIGYAYVMILLIPIMAIPLGTLLYKWVFTAFILETHWKQIMDIFFTKILPYAIGPALFQVMLLFILGIYKSMPGAFAAVRSASYGTAAYFLTAATLVALVAFLSHKYLLKSFEIARNFCALNFGSALNAAVGFFAAAESRIASLDLKRAGKAGSKIGAQAGSKAFGMTRGGLSAVKSAYKARASNKKVEDSSTQESAQGQEKMTLDKIKEQTKKSAKASYYNMKKLALLRHMSYELTKKYGSNAMLKLKIKYITRGIKNTSQKIQKKQRYIKSENMKLVHLQKQISTILKDYQERTDTANQERRSTQHWGTRIKNTSSQEEVSKMRNMRELQAKIRVMEADLDDLKKSTLNLERLHEECCKADQDQEAIEAKVTALKSELAVDRDAEAQIIEKGFGGALDEVLSLFVDRKEDEQENDPRTLDETYATQIQDLLVQNQQKIDDLTSSGADEKQIQELEAAREGLLESRVLVSAKKAANSVELQERRENSRTGLLKIGLDVKDVFREIDTDAAEERVKVKQERLVIQQERAAATQAKKQSIKNSTSPTNNPLGIGNKEYKAMTQEERLNELHLKVAEQRVLKYNAMSKLNANSIKTRIQEAGINIGVTIASKTIGVAKTSLEAGLGGASLPSAKVSIPTEFKEIFSKNNSWSIEGKKESARLEVERRQQIKKMHVTSEDYNNELNVPTLPSAVNTGDVSAKLLKKHSSNSTDSMKEQEIETLKQEQSKTEENMRVLERSINSLSGRIRDSYSDYKALREEMLLAGKQDFVSHEQLQDLHERIATTRKHYIKLNKEKSLEVTRHSRVQSRWRQLNKEITHKSNNEKAGE